MTFILCLRKDTTVKLDPTQFSIDIEVWSYKLHRRSWGCRVLVHISVYPVAFRHYVHSITHRRKLQTPLSKAFPRSGIFHLINCLKLNISSFPPPSLSHILRISLEKMKHNLYRPKISLARCTGHTCRNRQVLSRCFPRETIS